jgi:hypothetical protein
MARKKAPPGRLERLNVLFGTSLGRGLVRVTLAALVFLLAGIVMRQARAYTYRMDDFRVTPRQVRMVDLPAWADQRVQYALQPSTFRPFSISIYDPDAETKLRRELMGHSMVSRVEKLEVLYPNAARCTPVLRIPVAMAAVWADATGGRKRQKRAYQLLSNDGCTLDPAPYRAYLERLPYPLPVVTGITEDAPNQYGVVWQDRNDRVEEAIAAADLAQRIHRHYGGRITVKSIDVSRFTPDGRLRAGGELRLKLSCPPARKGGPRVLRLVEWGRTERAAMRVSHEDTYAKKMERLVELLGARNCPLEIDVRHHLAGGARTEY